jgi:hypothetical protein
VFIWQPNVLMWTFLAEGLSGAGAMSRCWGTGTALVKACARQGMNIPRALRYPGEAAIYPINKIEFRNPFRK